ncbi:hypothetical protein HXA34_05435 [Salipaludibacillus agaradhaerens]|jgi:hypothetical protein|uniref:hypothetical protein n=1 Tax=Salipaludibacillus agaradhaerens TaxID=76935 RepID=UPI002151C59C|nr:hypothetical protein [Salipaludibacillus agaradhaerens]MCR6105730.1 hypothetical protein [Salipaludibacillus agaradhaerens]MCR6117766.1 hypothetical protein [Salipaludibacillus agaradhaerens]UJW56934.1 hypothetical protein HXZ66_05635 [Bacillus sp. A116_S68]
MSRTTEMILGILGGLIGFGGAFFALFIGTVDEAVSGSSQISSLGTSAFLFSILAIIGAIIVKFKAKLGGWLMVISGVAILISISMFGVVPALFLISAGLMGILRKPKTSEASAA